MKCAFLPGALVILSTGCMPLRQETRVSGPERPSLLLVDDRCVLVGIDLNREKIVTGESFIADPTGKRFAVQVEPHHYDVEQTSEALRADVYPCGDDGSLITRWSDGVWRFHFAIETNGVTTVVDQQRRYRTFYYNPIVHGAPN